MSDNMTLYNAVRTPPPEALREIKAGRLVGKSDINPELKYYAVELCYWLQNNEKIKSILRSKNPDAKVRKDGGIFEI